MKPRVRIKENAIWYEVVVSANDFQSVNHVLKEGGASPVRNAIQLCIQKGIIKTQNIHHKMLMNKMDVICRMPAFS